jgi:hypothetical protein
MLLSQAPGLAGKQPMPREQGQISPAKLPRAQGQISLGKQPRPQGQVSLAKLSLHSSWPLRVCATAIARASRQIHEQLDEIGLVFHFRFLKPDLSFHLFGAAFSRWRSLYFKGTSERFKRLGKPLSSRSETAPWKAEDSGSEIAGQLQFEKRPSIETKTRVFMKTRCLLGLRQRLGRDFTRSCSRVFWSQKLSV